MGKASGGIVIIQAGRGALGYGRTLEAARRDANRALGPDPITSVEAEALPRYRPRHSIDGELYQAWIDEATWKRIYCQVLDADEIERRATGGQ